MSAHGLECFSDFVFLVSAPQTDRYYKNNTDNKNQNCLKNYMSPDNPFKFTRSRGYRN
jgi:hypothetical protein